MAVDVEADLKLNDRELTEKANVAEEMCRTWIRDVLNQEMLRPTPVAVYAFFAGDDEELANAKQARDDWCRLHEIYKAEMDRRVEVSFEARRTKAEVDGELTRMREEHKAEARKIEATTYETPGIVSKVADTVTTSAGELATSAEGAATKVGEKTLGFFEQLRENAFGVFGLATDQEFKDRLVGWVRLILAAIAIWAIWLAASRVVGGGVAVGERSAGRFKDTLLAIKDVPISQLGG